MGKHRWHRIITIAHTRTNANLCANGFVWPYKRATVSFPVNMHFHASKMDEGSLYGNRTKTCNPYLGRESDREREAHTMPKYKLQSTTAKKKATYSSFISHFNVGNLRKIDVFELLHLFFVFIVIFQTYYHVKGWCERATVLKQYPRQNHIFNSNKLRATSKSRKMQ